jgi:hypothetical protein
MKSEKKSRIMTGGFLFLVFFLIISFPAFLASPAQVWAADGDTPELCNGIDDDGDGAIDEGFLLGRESTASATNDCDDTVDNDGDGLVDGDDPQCQVEDVHCYIYYPSGCTPPPPEGADGLDCCATRSYNRCTADGLGVECTPVPNDVLKKPKPEKAPSPGDLFNATCHDSLDNDCDGLIDFADPDCQKPNETGLCNGLDDDNDGQIDEDFPGLGEPCTVGDGFCLRSGTIVCTKDGSSTECSVIPGPKSAENTPGTGHCVDGVDNDCDGLVDLADPNCQTTEVCDGLDNDGDGQVDEDFLPELGQHCSVGEGDCTSVGVYVCSADKTGIVCAATPQLGTPEGPAGITCRDGIDNDCDGLYDSKTTNPTNPDPDCDSANLAVSCALIPLKEKPGVPHTDCEGRFEVKVNSNAPEPEMVTAEMLALDTNGNLLGSLPVQNGDLVHLASRMDAYKLDMNGKYIDVFAPVPLLRVTANTGQRVGYAYCSPIPYLDVIKPSGDVVSSTEGSVVEVVVAIPRVDPKTLSVKVDCVDILAPLGIDPANDFPGGPFGGIVDIHGYPVTVDELFVQTSPFNILGSNTLTMQLKNLRAGGHIVVVDGEPLSSAVHDPTSAQCHQDDILDKGTVSVFGIEITSPTEGSVTNAVPTPVIGQVRSGRQIAGASVQGSAVDVSGQVFTPGDGECSADGYVLPINVTRGQTNLSFDPQPGIGTFDLGQNDLNVGAEDDQGNLAFAARRFTIGETLTPKQTAAFQSFRGMPLAALPLYSPALEKLNNAIVFGVSKDAMNAYFSSTCSQATGKLESKMREILVNAALPAKEIDLPWYVPVCDPTANLDVPCADDSLHFNGTLSCSATPEEGQVKVSLGIPDTTIKLVVGGGCCDCWWIFCLSELILDMDVEATVKNTFINFTITEELAKVGGESPAEYLDDGATVDVIVTRDDNDVNCVSFWLGTLIFGPLGGVIFELFDPVTGIVTDYIDGQVFSKDIKEALKNSDKDPLSVQKVELNEDQVALISKLQLVQELTDIKITSEGLTGTIAGEIDLTTPPDSEVGNIEATATDAPIPTMPVAGAQDVFFAVSDDLFGLLFAGLTAQGALQTECEPSGLTLADFLPADCAACDALTTPNQKGKCKGALGCDCSSIPALQQGACNDAKADFTNNNISKDTPVLFCARRGIAPRLLIEDNPATTGTVEARLHMNDLKVTAVLDKNGNGALGGSFATTPRCFGPLSDTTSDCKWGAGCFDFDLNTDLTLQMTNGKPLIVPTVGGVNGDPAGALCDGDQSFGGINDLLSQAGASNPITVIEANLTSLSSVFQTDGLDLGGFVQFTDTPKLIAIETADQSDCPTCQEYVGITGNIEPQPPESLCNGLDDDGDGKVDEGFDVGGDCYKGADSSTSTCFPVGTKVCSPDQTGIICQ